MLKVPGEHGAQNRVEVKNSPPAHCTDVVDPLEFDVVVDTHTDAPASPLVLVPTTHGLQKLVPAPLAYEFTTHGEHLVEPAMLNVPGAHS